MTVFRSLTFWIVTVVFLTAAASIGLMAVKPVLAKAKETRTQLKELDTKIAKEHDFAASIKSFSERQAEVNALYEKARLALPESPEPEQLQLQFDGLVAALGLTEATISVPFSAASPTPSTGRTKTEGEKQTASPSSSLTFTFTTRSDFAKSLELIAKLRTFSRWNKLSTINLSQSGPNFTITLEGQAYFKAAKIADYTPDPKVLERATALFASFTDFATVPDVKSEGIYGRTDPFATP